MGEFGIDDVWRELTQKEYQKLREGRLFICRIMSVFLVIIMLLPVGLMISNFVELCNDGDWKSIIFIVADIIFIAGIFFIKKQLLKINLGGLDNLVACDVVVDSVELVSRMQRTGVHAGDRETVFLDKVTVHSEKVPFIVFHIMHSVREHHYIAGEQGVIYCEKQDIGDDTKMRFLDKGV